MDITRGLVAIGAGMSVLTGMLTGLGQGLAASKVAPWLKHVPFMVCL